MQERLGFDLNVFEQSFPDLEVQKRVFQTYSFFLRTGLDWKKSGQTEYDDFQQFIASNLVFAQDEINVLFNEACPEAEEFMRLLESEDCPDDDHWPSRSYLSEYLEFRKKPFTSFNGFSTSKNN